MFSTTLESAWDLFKQKLLPIPATQRKVQFHHSYWCSYILVIPMSHGDRLALHINFTDFSLGIKATKCSLKNEWLLGEILRRTLELTFLPCNPEWGQSYFNFCLTLAARRSNQSILKDINPEYSLEGLMLSDMTKQQWLNTDFQWAYLIYVKEVSKVSKYGYFHPSPPLPQQTSSSPSIFQ